MQFLDIVYVQELFECLHRYLEQQEIPQLSDAAPPTLASKGPSYNSLDEVESAMEDRRRGLQTKPHFVTEAEMELARKRATRGKAKVSFYAIYQHSFKYID